MCFSIYQIQIGLSPPWFLINTGVFISCYHCVKIVGIIWNCFNGF